MTRSALGSHLPQEGVTDYIFICAPLWPFGSSHFTWRPIDFVTTDRIAQKERAACTFGHIVIHKSIGRKKREGEEIGDYLTDPLRV